MMNYMNIMKGKVGGYIIVYDGFNVNMRKKTGRL